jgi:hypothetical protein
MSAANGWQELITAALVGTERRPVPGAGPDDPAVALLDQAALLTVARRAGRLPGHAEALPVPDPDPRPVVSQAAGERLARILGGEKTELLSEWLTVVVRRGLQPPAHLLPGLLDQTRRSSAWQRDPGGGEPGEIPLGHLIAMAGGPRARWLAGLSRLWGDVAAAPELTEFPVAQYLSAAELADVLARAMRELSQQPLTANRVIRTAGRRADPALGAPALAATLMADFPPEAPNVLHAMLAVIRFRHDMLKELDNDHGDS